MDIEASGFGRGSYPIEVGYVRPDGSAFCTLVRPAPGWDHWDGSAERLHGLSRELLLRHGRPVADVVMLLNNDLAGQNVYCDGWAHDFAWLSLLFDAADRRPLFKLRHLHELLDAHAMAQWDQTCEQVRTEHPGHRHRASHDARVLQLSLARLRTEALNPLRGT